LFRCRLDAPPVPQRALAGLLSPIERERAASFVFERDRRRSATTWGLVRTVLGGIIGHHPASLRFTYTQLGKPALVEGPSFNVSHSEDLLLIAIADEGRLGVDIEVVRSVHDLDGLAERNFSPDEIQALRRAPAHERERAFFRTWTLKEAFIKALGGGLTIPLDSFSVMTDAAGPSAMVERPNFDEQPGIWSLRSIACSPEAEAAVAWDRPMLHIEWVELPLHRA
jgi:4'-phosphopantetheinyl transferase